MNPSTTNRHTRQPVTHAQAPFTETPFGSGAIRTRPFPLGGAATSTRSLRTSGVEEWQRHEG